MNKEKDFFHKLRVRDKSRQEAEPSDNAVDKTRQNSNE